MACHTLTEAAKLTGKSRRTIQRYVKSGKVSIKNGGNKNPTIDTAELIRVFGELSHAVIPKMSHHVAVTNYEGIADIISKAIIEANKPLYEEISALTEQIKNLTYRLDKPKEELNKTATLRIDKPIFMPENKTSNYLDDIPTFGKKK
ncbi:MAG: helix-turn-helix domain-containing protein [Alteromonadaceae bacterium]|nr:helix-turn-helix domain-containing protein [Alteromonadaceae bacterium]